MRKTITSLLISGLMACTLLADSGTSRTSQCDDDWNVERGFAAVGDVLLVRPLGTATTIASFGVFAVASPFAAMADATDEVFTTLVEEPADYTFNRELGIFQK